MVDCFLIFKLCQAQAQTPRQSRGAPRAPHHQPSISHLYLPSITTIYRLLMETNTLLIPMKSQFDFFVKYLLVNLCFHIYIYAYCTCFIGKKGRAALLGVFYGQTDLRESMVSQHRSVLRFGMPPWELHFGNLRTMVT